MAIITISCSEDGDVTVRRWASEEEFEKYVALRLRDGENVKFFDKCPGDANPQYWGSTAELVIRGDVVQPQPVEVVRAFRLPR